MSFHEKVYGQNFINQVSKYISPESYKREKTPIIVFLCGKKIKENADEKTNREYVIKYFEKDGNNLITLLSEHLWQDEFLSEIDLLTFEEFIVEICDYILIFVESYGSACELGAFTYHNKQYQKKLVVYMHSKFKNDKSFINQGPIEKIRKIGQRVIYTDWDKGLLGDEEVLKSLIDVSSFQDRSTKRYHKEIRENGNENVKIYLTTFLYEICELINLLQPISSKELISFYKRLKNIESFTFIKSDKNEFSSPIQVKHILKLLSVIGYISISSDLIKLNKRIIDSTFLFNYGTRTYSRIRSCYLAKKYKYEKIL